MLFDIGLVICCKNREAPLEQIIQPLIHLFNEHNLSHQFIFISDANDQQTWDRIVQLGRRFRSVTGYSILHRNQLESMALCGLMHAQSKIVVTMDDSLRFQPKAILAMYTAITQSNCDLIYGRSIHQSQPLRQSLSRFRRLIFSMLSGLSSEISSFRILKAHSLQGLKLRTPYQFSFDQQIQGKISNHSHLYFNGLKGRNAMLHIPRWKRWMILPFSWTYLGEVSLLALVILNLIFLLQGQLIVALSLGVATLVLIWILYMVKWRRSIAYKIVEKLLQ